MEKKDLILNVVEQALVLVEKMTEDDFIALENHKKELVLELKDKIEQGEKNDKSRRGSNKKGTYNERRSASEKGKRKSDKNEKENKKEKERGDKSSFEKINNEPPNEFDLYIRELSRFRNKEEATKYLLDNKLTVTKLKILAKKLSIYIKSKSKKIDIVEAIVEGIVGSMLKLEALREY
ncbi:MAG: hypothetical protein ACRCWM_13045 [Sarcina sp.]